jgi:hypothetical protein
VGRLDSPGPLRPTARCSGVSAMLVPTRSRPSRQSATGPSEGEAEYSFDVQDWMSGIWNGALEMAGPTGQTVSAPFVVRRPDHTPGGYDYGTLGVGDVHEQLWGFRVPVEFPTGSAPGVWHVTKVTVYHNADNVTVVTDPVTDTVTLTDDSALSASGFAISPAVLDGWTHDAYVTVTMSEANAVDGVSAIYLDETGGGQLPP